MKKYNVCIPFTGVIVVTVDADNEKSAKFVALEYTDSIKIDIKMEDSDIDVDLSELQFHEYIVEGNVFLGCLNKIEIESAQDDS